MPVEHTSPNTGTTLSSQSTESELWDANVQHWEQNTDYWQQFEGRSHESCIITQTDTSKGRGQKITFRAMAGFYGEAKKGEELFENESDFEPIKIDDYNLTVDYQRNAVRITERAEEFMGLRGQIKAGLPKELGKWLGREKFSCMSMEFRERTDADNQVFVGSKTMATLKSAHTLSWDEIVAAGIQLKRLNGKPMSLRTGLDGKGKVYGFALVAPTDSLYSLKIDTNYKNLLQEAGERGRGNLLFTGDYARIDNHMICEHNPIDHDGDGPIGSPMNPKAFLGEAITAGTTTFDVKGGGNATAAAQTAKYYFKWFPNHAFKFTPADTLSQDSDTHYFLVVNPSNASTDPNKIGMYSYTTGNNGHKITIVNRLGSAASGARVTTLGGVTWNTGVWNGIHTDAHPVGATIVPCTENGVPFGDAFLLGRGAAYRGYGKYRNKRGIETHENGFVQDVFIRSVFGQTLRRDAAGRAPGVLRLRHAINYAGLPIPTVT